MAISLNRKAVSHIRALINAGKVDTSDAWSFDAAAGDKLLGEGGDDWSTYGQVHLGIDEDADDKTKAHFKYPVAKGGKVYLSALRAAITRASQNDAKAIAEAARKMLADARPSEHAGFDDWIEVFQTGKQTDSAGRTQTWSREDLDQMVANHDASQPAPLVIGHPKNDSPAWGWTRAVKRVGNKLVAKFSHVPDAVADAVREGRYRNRSIKLSRGESGYKLIHVGLLGAAPPGVEGLAPIAFEAEPEGVTYQFNAVDAAGLSLIARGMQKLREMIIAHFGADEADRYMPQHDIDSLTHVAKVSASETTTDDDVPQPAFARHDDEDPAMDQKLKDDLDAATKRATKAETQLAEFAAQQRSDEAKRTVDALLAEGKLTPAQAAGLPEFMASLDDATDIEFAAGDDTQTLTGAAYFAEFLGRLPKQIELNKRHADTDDAVGDDADEIIQAAREFQAAEHAKGNEIAWHEAVSQVTAGAKQ
ncbi:MAG TPA: phage protease [Oleiagrimonas sp.]|nr:phage protease [Oleiagrimonas sp.]